MRALLVATALLLAACSASSPGPARQTWLEVKGLGHVVVAASAAGQAGWLLGGGVIGSDGVNHVAIWSAVAPAGPWRRDAMSPVAGRDGPNETIQGFGIRPGPGPLTAVGSRPSPTEGYPRPSTWLTPSSGTAWQEVLAGRELFGGPNVVAIAGMGAGPHGYFVAGTWVTPDNHVVASVWRSATGARWSRDDTEPAFDAGPGTQSYALTVADGPQGVLLGGTTATPVAGDPTRQLPTLWHSPDGSRWTRLPTPRLPGLPGRGAVHAIRAFGPGWLAAGQLETWLIDSHLHATSGALSGPEGSTVTDLAVTPGAVLAAGVTPAGTVLVWRAARHGEHLDAWQAVSPPPTGPGWSGASLAAAGNQVVLVVFNDTTSRVWRAG